MVCKNAIAEHQSRSEQGRGEQLKTKSKNFLSAKICANCGENKAVKFIPLLNYPYLMSVSEPIWRFSLPFRNSISASYVYIIGG